MNVGRESQVRGGSSMEAQPAQSEDLEMVERFETTLNAIHKVLRALIGADGHVPFLESVTRYASARPYWTESAEFLRQIAKLRNFIVHERTRPYGYLAVPVPVVITRLGQIYAELTEPRRAIPVFQRSVVTVGSETRLTEVLHLIATHDFSQFPVYENRVFRGLLTENGITRWVAHHALGGKAIVRLEGVLACELLGDEETRSNVAFVKAITPVADVRLMFSQQGLLEAALFTEAGSESSALLGIATRWDIAALQ